MKYKITHTTKYAYSEAVPVCHNLAHLAPRQLEFQRCHDFRLLVRPDPNGLYHRSDYFGNQVSYFSIDQPHRGLTVTSFSEVEVSDKINSPAPATTVPWDQLAAQVRGDRTAESLDAFQYVFASPFVKPWNELLDYSRPVFSSGRPILEAVMALTDQIHRDFAYDERATTIHTPIREVFEKRGGVCQDFAHLQIGCLRSLGLPARYVSGYLRTIPPPGKPRLVGADASHAWVSVYCGEHGWIDVDPTNNTLVGQDHVVVAWGRDYSDVCPVQGVIVGGGEHRMNVSIDVAPQ